MEISNIDIIDGLHLAYEDDPALEAACLVFLANMTPNEQARLAWDAGKALDDACRCRKCGQVMSMHHGKEWHDEVQDYESYVEAYCPHCDIAEEDM